MILSKKINHFLSVAECGSFKNASKNIHISPPALCKSIADIEDSLGFKLFNRSNAGVTLTEEGISLYKYLLPIRDDVESIKSSFPTALTKKEIKVGTDSYNKSFNKLISKIIENGQVDLLSEMYHFDEHRSKLLSGELDLFISTHPPVEDKLERISCKIDVRESEVFIVSKKLLDKNNSLVDLVCNEKMILHSGITKHPFFDELLKYRKEKRINTQILVFPDVSHIIDFVCFDIGYSVINNAILDSNYLKNTGLIIIPNTLFSSELSSYIYYLKRKELELIHYIN
ncbi:LysR family transcriptional regulator [Xenorhabdus anantnagensis]|uniref:LysR family transcriptional regulator n=1 Tax=Xenorhabdus anantnagensis TaxID=3025875 RepID=A0ABT5LST4_9GAMM|nr:LysR family transcriptional regulator [Xenorhabdus anantnagensis]MDC9597400.1 LysR family transcriptional regulator [Xenorhabdus anantnagensis]